MLHRVRTLTRFELSLPPSNIRRSLTESENSTTLLMAAYQQHFRTNKVTFDSKQQRHSIGDITIQKKGQELIIKGDDDYARFEILCAEIKALDNEQRNNASSFLLLQAMARGITITPIDIELGASTKKEIKHFYKKNQELAKTNKVNNILTAKIIDKSTYEKNKRADGIQNTQTHYENVRFKIANTFNKPTESLKTEDINFFIDNGNHFVENFQALQQGTAQAKAHDTHDKNRGVAKTSAKWRESKIKLLCLLFDILKIDKKTGAGAYQQSQTEKARQAIKQDDMLRRYLTFKLQLNVDSYLSDTAFVNKIIKKLLGVKIRRTLVRDNDKLRWYYTINKEDMVRLNEYRELKFGKEIIHLSLETPNLLPETYLVERKYFRICGNNRICDNKTSIEN